MRTRSNHAHAIEPRAGSSSHILLIGLPRVLVVVHADESQVPRHPSDRNRIAIGSQSRIIVVHMKARKVEDAERCGGMQVRARLPG